MSNDRILTLTYDDLTDYDYDDSLIESNGLSALLKLINNAGLLFTQDFSSDSGFTYDSSLAEFVGGQVQQKDQRPDDAILGHTFNQSSNQQLPNWASMALTTVNNGATFSSNKMSMVGDQYISHTGVIPINGKGAIKMKITDRVGGAASDVQRIFKLQNNISSENGLLELKRTLTTFRVAGKRADGSIYLNDQSMGSFSMSQDQKIELLFMWDFVTGAIALYVDGTRIGYYSTSPTYLSSYGYMVIGGLAGQTLDFDDIVLYNDNPVAISEMSYTIGYTLPEYAYLESSIVLPTFTYSGIGAIISVDDVTILESGTPRYITGGYYWNGVAWVTSDGSYDQANDAATFAAQVINFPVTGAGEVDMTIVFPNSDIVPTQSVVDYFSIEITGQKYSVSNPAIIVSDGTYLDGIGSFTVNSNKPTDTELKYIINVNNINYYWTGTAWAVSDGTFSQSNNLTELNTNISSFDFDLGKIFKLKVFLSTVDENATPSLASITMTYDFAVNPSYPNVCKVWGFVVDITSEPVEGAEVTFSVDDYYNESNLITKDKKVVTDANGYWEADLIKTVDDGTQFNQNVKYTDISGASEEYDVKLIVPDQDTASIKTCIDLAAAA